MPPSDSASALAGIATYYAQKIAAHGETALGVDWNGAESQSLRFEQLAKLISRTSGFTINDLGCGYGALFDYLLTRYDSFQYRGYDIATEMISAAQKRHGSHDAASYRIGAQPDSVADYTVASGIFNVRLDKSKESWTRYFKTTLDAINEASTLGFAFNCLTSYSDKERMRQYLYYSNPCEMFDLCKQRYSRNVALLHDYGLYEYTIIVRK